jgi:hypothetical protein
MEHPYGRGKKRGLSGEGQRVDLFTVFEMLSKSSIDTMKSCPIKLPDTVMLVDGLVCDETIAITIE